MKLFALILVLAIVGVFAADEPKGNEKVKGYVIGIDLGTTFSCVGVYRNGKTEIIANELGSRITPSYVAFTEEQGTLIGEAAKNQAPSNARNTLYDIKRIIGRRFKDSVTQREIKSLPYKIFNQDGMPHVRVTSSGATKELTMEEASAMVLRKMKATAEAFLNEPIEYAVVTVPAYFNDAQRAATKAAGAIAGLTVLRIINEPTAAAIAYGLDADKKSGDKVSKKVLVYDLGGGTFDVSLLNIDEGVYEVEATNGDTHLGGEDFDLRIMSHFEKLLEKKAGKSIKDNVRAMHRLKREAELAKIKLSTSTSATIEVENILDGVDLKETLTRARFEALNQDLFKKTLRPVTKVLKDAKITKEQVDEVVLVGGSTRIPKVRALLKEYFDGKELNLDVNPDEAIAFGAAVQGGILSNNTGEEILMIDVTPLTLGTEDEDGVMVKLVHRNSPIPIKKSSPFTTVEDNQQSVLFRIFQGERSLAKYNHLLGEFNLAVPPAPKGVPEIRVTFEVDVNGILKVNAKDVGSGNEEKIRITQDTGRLTSSEIEKILADAEENEEEEKQLLAKIEARKELEGYAESVKSSLISVGKKLKKSEKKEALDAAKRVLKWLKYNKDRDVDTYEDKKTKLEELVNPIMTKLYKQQREATKDADVQDEDEPADNKMFSSDDEPEEEQEHEKAGEFDEDLDRVVEPADEEEISME